jgi:hypothetical protein
MDGPGAKGGYNHFRRRDPNPALESKGSMRIYQLGDGIPQIDPKRIG